MLSLTLSSLSLAGALAAAASASALPGLAGRQGTVSPDNTCGTTGAGGTTVGYTCPPELSCCSQQ